MTSRREKTTLSLLAAGAALLAMWIAEPPSAHADVNPDDAELFCSRLDVDASPATFFREAGNTILDGLTKDEAAELIVYAVNEVCPEYLPAFQVAVDSLEKETLLNRAV